MRRIAGLAAEQGSPFSSSCTQARPVSPRPASQPVCMERYGGGGDPAPYGALAALAGPARLAALGLQLDPVAVGLLAGDADGEVGLPEAVRVGGNPACHPAAFLCRHGSRADARGPYGRNLRASSLMALGHRQATGVTDADEQNPPGDNHKAAGEPYFSYRTPKLRNGPGRRAGCLLHRDQRIDQERAGRPPD